MGDEKVLEKLKKVSGYDNIRLTSSGDTAIEAAMIIAKKRGYKKILIPDQGGWFSYRKLPTKLNIEYEEIKTRYGVIIPEELKKHKDCAFIFTSFAGYFAEQFWRRIYKICKRNNILLIEDVTGTIGWKKSNADFVVSSFSKWKPVNLGYGGFIAAKEKANLEIEDAKDFLDKNNFEKADYYSELIEKLDALPKRYKFFFNLQRKVKKDLREFEVIHRRDKGLNVVAKFSNDEEKEKLINYCKKNNYEFVKCPSYIKVNTNAISIELKRLEE